MLKMNFLLTVLIGVLIISCSHHGTHKSERLRNIASEGGKQDEVESQPSKSCLSQEYVYPNSYVNESPLAGAAYAYLNGVDAPTKNSFMCRNFGLFCYDRLTDQDFIDLLEEDVNRHCQIGVTVAMGGSDQLKGQMGLDMVSRIFDCSYKFNVRNQTKESNYNVLGSLSGPALPLEIDIDQLSQMINPAGAYGAHAELSRSLKNHVSLNSEEFVKNMKTFFLSVDEKRNAQLANSEKIQKGNGLPNDAVGALAHNLARRDFFTIETTATMYSKFRRPLASKWVEKRKFRFKDYRRGSFDELLSKDFARDQQYSTRGPQTTAAMQLSESKEWFCITQVHQILKSTPLVICSEYKIVDNSNDEYRIGEASVQIETDQPISKELESDLDKVGSLIQAPVYLPLCSQ